MLLFIAIVLLIIVAVSPGHKRPKKYSIQNKHYARSEEILSRNWLDHKRFNAMNCSATSGLTPFKAVVHKRPTTVRRSVTRDQASYYLLQATSSLKRLKTKSEETLLTLPYENCVLRHKRPRARIKVSSSMSQAT